MERPMRLALATAGLALLVGCSGMELQNAESTPSQGNEFNRNLQEGYVKLSEDEFNEADYDDSDHFAMRSMEAAKGGPVQPEMISSRNLPEDKVAELANERERLMRAMAAGASEAKPLDAAEAQVSFDCWMQEQEENFQPEDIAACRDRFMTAMAALEVQPQVTAAPAPAPEPMMAPEPAAFTVHFDFDDSGLTPDARAMLADVAAAAKKSDYQTIDISGYTDLMGSDSYNQVLSEQRANAVINFLVDSGIEAGKIIGKGYGKADPVVNVQAPEMENRRVEIKLEP